MYHSAKMPEENGWYWVRFKSGGAVMAFFEPEDEHTVGHYLHERIQRSVAFDSETVAEWIGPLPCPFGDLASDGAYFAADQYREAIRDGKSLVMTLVDGGGGDRSFGTAMGVYQMPLDEALCGTGTMFRKLDRRQ